MVMVRRRGGCGLNEIKTGMIERRLSNNDGIDMLNSGRQVVFGGGYRTMLFVGTMLHLSLGISETELLKLMDSGKAVFDTKMLQKFNNPEDYNNCINVIKANVNLLYKMLFDKNIPDDNFKENDSENKINAINIITKSCICMMEKRIQKELPTNVDRYEKYVTKCTYEAEGIIENYLSGMRGIEPICCDDKIENTLDSLRSMVGALNLEKYVTEESKKVEAISIIKENSIVGFSQNDIKERFNESDIKIDKEKYISNINYSNKEVLSRLERDYDGNAWNNSEMEPYVKDIMGKNSFSTHFLNYKIDLTIMKGVMRLKRKIFDKSSVKKLPATSSLLGPNLDFADDEKLQKALEKMVNNELKFTRYEMEDTKHKNHSAKEDVGKGYKEI